MTDLNKELTEYLSKNEKQFKIDVPSVPIPKPNLFGRKWFGQNIDEVRENAGWFERMQGNCCPNLTLVTRYKYITVCILLGALCFTLKIIYFFKGFRLRKVALLHSVGSLFFLLAFCLLWGSGSFLNCLKSLFTAERRCFTVAYLAALTGTLYSIHLESTTLTLLCLISQYTVIFSVFLSSSYLLGSKLFGLICKSSVKSSLLSDNIV